MFLVMGALVCIVVIWWCFRLPRKRRQCTALYLSSAPLRRTSQWPIVGDVVMIASGYAAFEYVFYYMAHHWQYENDAELQHTIATAYRDAAGANAVAECSGCVERLQQKLAACSDTEREWILRQLEQVTDKAVAQARPRVEAARARAEESIEAQARRQVVERAQRQSEALGIRANESPGDITTGLIRQTYSTIL